MIAVDRFNIIRNDLQINANNNNARVIRINKLENE